MVRRSSRKEGSKKRVKRCTAFLSSPLRGPQSPPRGQEGADFHDAAQESLTTRSESRRDAKSKDPSDWQGCPRPPRNRAAALCNPPTRRSPTRRLERLCRLSGGGASRLGGLVEDSKRVSPAWEIAGENNSQPPRVPEVTPDGEGRSVRRAHSSTIRPGPTATGGALKKNRHLSCGAETKGETDVPESLGIAKGRTRWRR